MACPKCGCKETCQYDDDDDALLREDFWERCAACGHVFDIEDSLNEEDEPMDDATRYALGSM